VKTVRTTSNADVNGALQAVQQDVEIRKQISPDVKETTTSVSILESEGLTECVRTEQRETRRGHSIEFQKTNLARDVNGRWQTREVRQGVTKEDGTQRSEEENVLRPDSDGKMSVVRRTTKRETNVAGGEKQTITEAYSVDLPGMVRDGKLHLVERVTAVARIGQNGRLFIQVKIEDPNPGSPTNGLRVTTQSVEVIVRGTDGIAHENRSVKGIDLNGNLSAVRLDIGTSDKPEP
jgi:hypothetical protein